MLHEPGLILNNLDLLRVIDGDTIEVSITRKFKVRIRDVDTDELNTDKGQEAKTYLSSLLNLKNPPELTIFIPSNKPEQLLDFHSFDRIVADLFANGLDVAEALKKAGFQKNEHKSKMPD